MGMIDRPLLLKDLQNLLRTARSRVSWSDAPRPRIRSSVSSSSTNTNKPIRPSGRRRISWIGEGMRSQQMAGRVAHLLCLRSDSSKIIPWSRRRELPDLTSNGSSGRGQEHEAYFQKNPHPSSDRDYLLGIFDDVEGSPRNAQTSLARTTRFETSPDWLSGDAAGELINFFQKITIRRPATWSTTSRIPMGYPFPRRPLSGSLRGGSREVSPSSKRRSSSRSSSSTGRWNRPLTGSALTPPGS